MALFPYNSDPKYSVYDINNSQDLKETSKRCDYIQIGLRLYSHLFCRGFIFHYFCIYLSILLSISSGSVTAYSSRVQDSPLSCCSILSFLSNFFLHLFHSSVFFWQLYCLSFDLHHMITPLASPDFSHNMFLSICFSVLQAYFYSNFK
jgi:hypothetical protein